SRRAGETLPVVGQDLGRRGAAASPPARRAHWRARGQRSCAALVTNVTGRLSPSWLRSRLLACSNSLMRMEFPSRTREATMYDPTFFHHVTQAIHEDILRQAAPRYRVQEDSAAQTACPYPRLSPLQRLGQALGRAVPAR